MIINLISCHYAYSLFNKNKHFLKHLTFLVLNKVPLLPLVTYELNMSLSLPDKANDK